MISLLRSLARDLLSRTGRYLWLELLVREVPGGFGNALRSWVLGRRFASKGEGLIIHHGVLIKGPHKLKVGRNCRIGANCVLQANGGIELGDDVLFGPGVKIWSVNHRFDRTDVTILEQGWDLKPVVIGDGVWFGANSFVMPGARIGDHVVVSAGSIVAGKDIEPYSILAGNPARRVGSRLERGMMPGTPTDDNA